MGYGERDRDELITREQLAAMLWRYAKYSGVDVSAGENTDLMSYKDAPQISEYAIPAIRWACGSGIMSGYEDATEDATLRPANNATRAEAAALTQRYDDSVK